MIFYFFFFFKQKTAYEMRISDWSSDVCSSDLRAMAANLVVGDAHRDRGAPVVDRDEHRDAAADLLLQPVDRPAQFLGIEPVDHLRQERHIADLLDRRPGSRPATAAPSTAKRQCQIGRAHV